jgi:hypothetical protein
MEEAPEMAALKLAKSELRQKIKMALSVLSTEEIVSQSTGYHSA